MPELTPWFEAHINPFRVGYYERDYSNYPDCWSYPDYWNGRLWILCASNGKRIRPAMNRLPWRGLRSPA